MTPEHKGINNVDYLLFIKRISFWSTYFILQLSNCSMISVVWPAFLLHFADSLLIYAGPLDRKYKGPMVHILSYEADCNPCVKMTKYLHCL